MRTTLRLAIVWLLVAIPSIAVAEGDDTPMKPEAKQHFESGSAHYNLGEYDEAVAEFKAAYRAEQRSQFLWGIAQAERLKGDCATAIRSYEAFLRSSPTEEGAKLALDQIAVCKKKLEDQPAPPPKPVEPPPVPRPVTTPPPPPPSPSSQGAWLTGHLLVWSGAALAIAGGVTLVIADRRMSSVASQPAYGDYITTRDSTKTLQEIGVGVAAVGGVLAAVGVTGFLVRGHHESSSVSITLAPSGTGLAVAGRF